MTTSEDAPPEPAAARSAVQAIDRAVAILRCFSARSPELGISEISRATGLSTSTAHRLLTAMLHNRLVRQTAHRRYALGPLLIQLARSGAVPTTLRDIALGPMHELRDLTDETVGLHELLPSFERAVVDQVESRQPLRRTYTELGEAIPLVYGAPGKAMLAFVPEATRERLLATPISSVTPATITDPGLLRAQLDEVRERGFATSYAERTPGIRTVAAPVFDHTGKVVGCLSVSGPETRMPQERMDELTPLVTATAWTISESLGAHLSPRLSNGQPAFGPS
ncbi:IclR family transcriptional regulator [Nonomuraea sp. K274]|uniref:Glycerol operon regulatory protein n=1 Tax=Nonomuraea cypriaca TaxID=1187855 RepID=A0A931AL74_9ACTN|nr:IclR family transcriptional regulator [Nonomuraea cypriaca]MBF8193815.1 IclR family transcriptional regulator [Nonomuraea cypriaca]